MDSNIDNIKIGIIGLGRVGCSLALVFNDLKFNIKGLYTRSNETFEVICKKIDDTKIENNIHSLINDCNLIFISTPDSEIRAISDIVVTQGIDIKDKVFIHLSGACDSKELKSIKDEGGYTGSLHPIQTFADKYNSFNGLKNIYFGFEGDERAYQLCCFITDMLSSKLIKIPKENKPLYHAACCVISNYFVTLSYVAKELMINAGIDSNDAITALMTLVNKTVDNVSNLGPEKALTGPLARGDINTINSHINTMNSHKEIMEYKEIYTALGLLTTKIALKNELINKKVSEEIIRTLKS